MDKYEAVYFFKFNEGKNGLEQVLPVSLRADPEVVIAACTWGRGKAANLQHAADSLRSDKAFALSLAKVDDEGAALQYLPPSLQDDKEVVLALVSRYRGGTNLAFASDRLKADDEVVRAALASNGHALAHVPAARRQERALIDVAYGQTCDALAHVPQKLLDSRDFVLDFVTERRCKDGVLRYFPAFVSDREIVMEILTHDAPSLQHADPALRDDPLVVLHAMFSPRINDVPAMGFEFAGASIRKDKAFVADAIARLKGYRTEYRARVTTAIKDVHKVALAADKGAGAAEIVTLKATLRDVRKALQDDPNSQYTLATQTQTLDAIQDRLAACKDHAVLMTAYVEVDYLRSAHYAKTRGESVARVSPKLMANRKFLEGLMKVTQGEVLAQLPASVQGDADFVLATLGYHTPPDAIAPALRRDPAFLLAMLSRVEFFSQIEKIVDAGVWTDRAVVLALVARDGDLLQFASPALKADREVVMTAFTQDPSCLRYADPAFFQDRELMAAALKAGASEVVKVLPEPLVSDVAFLIDCLQALPDGRSTMARTLIAHVPRSVRSDLRFLDVCLRKNGWGIESVAESLRYDPQVLTAAFASGMRVWNALDVEKLKALFSKEELLRIMDSQSELDAMLRA